MKSIADIRRENLLKVLKAKGMTKSELAKLLNRSPQQISAVTTGYKSIGTKLIRDIEKVLGLEENYLDADKNIEEVTESRKTKLIPILSWVHAGDPHDIGDCDYSETMAVDEDVPDGCFALRVNGDSMVPEFIEDTPIVINPSLHPKPGDFVVARVCSVAGTCETTLKQYALVGVDEYGREVFELRPLNHLYAPLRSDKLQIEVLGVVIENRKRYR